MIIVTLTSDMIVKINAGYRRKKVKKLHVTWTRVTFVHENF